MAITNKTDAMENMIGNIIREAIKDDPNRGKEYWRGMLAGMVELAKAMDGFENIWDSYDVTEKIGDDLDLWR